MTDKVGTAALTHTELADDLHTLECKIAGLGDDAPTPTIDAKFYLVSFDGDVPTSNDQEFAELSALLRDLGEPDVTWDGANTRRFVWQFGSLKVEAVIGLTNSDERDRQRAALAAQRTRLNAVATRVLGPSTNAATAEPDAIEATVIPD